MRKREKHTFKNNKLFWGTMIKNLKRRSLKIQGVVQTIKIDLEAEEMV